MLSMFGEGIFKLLIDGPLKTFQWECGTFPSADFAHILAFPEPLWSNRENQECPQTAGQERLTKSKERHSLTWEQISPRSPSSPSAQLESHRPLPLSSVTIQLLHMKEDCSPRKKSCACPALAIPQATALAWKAQWRGFSLLQVEERCTHQTTTVFIA